VSLAESLIAQFRSSRDLVTPNLTTRLRVRKSAAPAIGVAMLALLWVPPLQAQSQDKDQPPAASSAGGMSNPSTDNQDKSGNPAQKDTSQKDEPPQNRVRAEQAKGNQDKGDTKEKELTPEEKMNRRFPQPVRVGVLIGKPVLDGDDQTLGYVHDVVRAPDGKISLIVDYSAWFGWFGHPVAVPIEVVASIGKSIAALDMPPEEFAKAPTWTSKDEKPIPHDEMIRIAVARR